MDDHGGSLSCAFDGSRFSDAITGSCYQDDFVTELIVSLHIEIRCSILVGFKKARYLSSLFSF
jgi:hypothetical protein